ncbi:MAG: chromosomal replication initiator protein DnaA, partial [Paracoccaceae bacterium]
MTNDKWVDVCNELQSAIGKNNFKSWIEPIEFDRIDARIARFRVPTNFFGTWVSQKFGDVILRHLHGAGLAVDRLEFLVQSTPQTPNTPQTPAVGAPVQSAPDLSAAISADADIPLSNLNPAYTFENFIVGKPNELAHAAARRVAEGGPVAFNPLFLYGGVGLGKTHLMHAIAWELTKNKPNQRIHYLSAEQFMYRFVRALREKDTIGFKQMFRSVDVLMVDDVQFIAGKNSTQEEFFHTFNALVELGKQIIISGDRAPVDMEDLDSRIASRLQCGLVVDLHPTDYELRLGILQARRDKSGVEVSDKVLDFLARKITSNIR